MFARNTKAFAVVLGLSLFSSNSFAEPASITDPNFQSVNTLLNSMTSEQRAAVMQRAKEQEKELAKLSPEEHDRLENQLKAVSSTIQMDKIDPAKLDVSKSKDTKQIQSDLNNYQAKYQAGKIDNPVVRQKQ